MTELSDEAWVAEIICSVEYSGSAIGRLKHGSYLVIRKPDNSISIHASDKNLPRNYLRATTISYNNEHSKIVCTNKKESITINVDIVKWIQKINLSTETVVITNSEKQLVDKLERQIKQNENAVTTREFVTSAGKIDLAVEYKDKNNYLEIYEAKRRKLTLADIYQLKRYSNTISVPHKCFLVAPSISPNAEKNLAEHNIEFIQLSWDD